MTIAFDVDYTLINADNTPNYEVIELLHWFQRNGDRIIVWSGGGVPYADTWARKLGIGKYIATTKTRENAKRFKVDIAVDDEFVELGKVNIKVTNTSKKDGGNLSIIK